MVTEHEMDQSAVLNRLHGLSKEGDPAFERMQRLREKVSLIRFIPDAQIANRDVYKYVYGVKDWDKYLKPKVNHQESELLAGWCGEGFSVADAARIFKPHHVEHIYSDQMVRHPEDKPLSVDAIDKLEIISQVFAPESPEVRKILRRALVVACRDSGLADEISRVMKTKFENEEHQYYAGKGERGYIQSGVADNMMVHPYIDAHIPLLHDLDGKFLNGDSIFESVVDQLVRYAQPYVEEGHQQAAAPTVETTVRQLTESAIPLGLLLDVFAQVPNGDAAVDAALEKAHLAPDQRVLVLTQLKEMMQRVITSQEIRSEVPPLAVATVDTVTQEAKMAELQEKLATLEGQLKDMQVYASLYEQAQKQIRDLQQQLAQKSAAAAKVVSVTQTEAAEPQEVTAWSEIPLSTRLQELKELYESTNKLTSSVDQEKRSEWLMLVEKLRFQIDYYKAEQNKSPVLRRVTEMTSPDDKVMFDAFYRSVKDGKPLPCPYTDEVYNTFSTSGLEDQRYQFLLARAKENGIGKDEKGKADFRRRYIRNFIAPSVFSFFLATNDITEGQLHKDVFAARSVLKDAIFLSHEDGFTARFLGKPDKWVNSLIDRPTGDTGVELDTTQTDIVNKVLDDITSGIIDFPQILRQKFPSLTQDTFIHGRYERMYTDDLLVAIPTFLTEGWGSSTNLSQLRTYQGLSSFLLEMAADPKKFEMGRFINTEG